VLGAASPATAWAQAEGAAPTTRIAAVFGGRGNTGRLGDRYALGYVLGVEAGWQPSVIGLSWSLLGGWFKSTRDDNVDRQLSFVELGVAARGRFLVGRGELQTFATVHAGARPRPGQSLARARHEQSAAQRSGRNGHQDVRGGRGPTRPARARHE
jgi:hypothetical protein